MARISFKNIVPRITGISTPVFGISWEPPESEREVIRGLLTYLEDRRALYLPYQWETPQWVVESVLEIRQELTNVLRDLPEDSAGVGSLRAMRSSCRRFLDDTARMHDGPRRGWGMNYLEHPQRSEAFFTALGQLRGVFGIHIAQLCVEYGIDLEDGLAQILPPAPAKK